jgi:hypothetical protein
MAGEPCNVSVAVIERALNHLSGTFAGIVGVYQKQKYPQLRNEAFEKWGAHVTALVNPKT